MMVLSQIGSERSYLFKNEEEKRNFIQLLRRTTKIIYRADPAQKHLFISALKESGSQAAITGSNVADVSSLKAATVSYCLGANGCTVARLNSDFVILDNDF